MLYILLAIFIFGVVVALHELGHFATAKWVGVRVNEFAVGMGPQIFSVQKGETKYSLRAIPFGGYCAMEGEDDGSEDPRSFHVQAGWKKFIILFAGSFMNFVTGFVIIAILLGQAQAFVVPVVEDLMEGFPYESAEGLLPGDRILEVDGEPIYTKTNLDFFFAQSPTGIMDLVIERDGEVLQRPQMDLSPREYLYEGELVTMRGIICQQVPFSVGTWLQESWYNAIDMVRMVRLALQQMFSGTAGLGDISGPVGIMGMMSDVGEQSASTLEAVLNILWFGGFIAINLAVMNLLPFPGLDGGRILFLFVNGIYTALTKKKLNPKYEGYINLVGLGCLLLLMVVVTFQDISKLFL